jgi:hypothetical protein
MIGFKIILTSLVVVGASELSKQRSFWSGIIVSLPLTSLLTFIWIYLESGDNQRVAEISQSVLILVPISLVFFLPFTFQSRTLFSFWLNLFIAVFLTASLYFIARKLRWC